MRFQPLVSGLVVSAVIVVGSSAMAAPAHAAQDDGLTLLVPTLAPMQPGQQGWVSAMWSANVDVCDTQMTISASGSGSLPTFTYPSNTATYSSFYTSSALAAGNLDYVAFKVAVPASLTASSVKLTLNVTYQQLPPGQIKKDDDLKVKKVDCKGPKGNMQVSATLPILAGTDPAVVQRTTAVTVPRSTPAWAHLAFRGNRPNLTNFRVALAPPAGLSVSYPGEGTSAGLNSHVDLPVAEDDYVAVRLDTHGLAPGDYRVPVKATYTGGSFDGELTVTVT